MAQNFLYMFEFVVDNLLVTRRNKCAPEEYPTCCEITFRSSVFVSICDKEYGECLDPCTPKCGKCVLFSLESPINKKDRLLIHVYKKKDNNCKFLIGATDMKINTLFDKVTDDFDIENTNWMEAVTRHHQTMPDPKDAGKKRTEECIPCPMDDDGEGRREQFCPTSAMTKGLLPLFNMKGEQTGNLTLLIRLVCNGPAIVSISNMSAGTCGGKKKGKCYAVPMPDPCAKPPPEDKACRRYFSCTQEKGCPCESCVDAPCGACPKKPKCKKSKPCPPPCPNTCRSRGGYDEQCDCCDDFSSSEKCAAAKARALRKIRYLMQNMSCACSWSSMQEDDSCSDESSEDGSMNCYMEPTPRDPGPDAFEEFEACLNGSALAIRVLKDTHQMASVYDGADPMNDDDDSYCGNKSGRSNQECDNSCETLGRILRKSKFAQNSLRRRTGGCIVNNPQIPKVRANIKYAGTDTGCVQNYSVPFTKVKNSCASGASKLDKYRKKMNQGGCGPIAPAMPPDDTRSCCVQVNPDDIKDMLKGVNADSRKKGIEVCYKSCDDAESDVFLVKLGAKKAREFKQHSIEIELRTPKIPIPCPIQKCTTETQINEVELDAALGKKGRRGKKGKGKGKKK